MYRTCCLYCDADLGGNSALDTFPVGRRVAFDDRRGRLWVVCARCSRWNLSPLETRWETVDECARLFPTLRRQAATDEVTLAWGEDRFSLVAIGRGTTANELAAWRYGRILLRRRVRALPLVAGVTAAAGIAGAAAASTERRAARLAQ
jgi:hypothetical protein